MNEKITDLRFKATDLGVIREGEFTQKPLTVFCGPNNSGKTWAMYSLYHFYQFFELTIVFCKQKETEISFAEFNKAMSAELGTLFNTSAENIRHARFKIQMETGDWKKLLEQEPKQENNNVFLMPAERNGLHLFFRELSTRRTALLHHASKENININELLRDVIKSRYAMPIANYINWLNGLTDVRKSKSTGFHDYAQQLQKTLAGGAYKIDSRTGDITFKPYQRKRDGVRTEALGLHLTSSTVKSLFGLWFYLEYQAEKGDVLMIDEPELNIHPENQRKIARLLAQLVNAGLNVVVSTHSDYMVREFNSLIMLSQDEDKVLRKKHKYSDNEILTTEQVGAYLFDEQTIKPFEITADDGIYATTFDEVIRNLNDINDDIYYSLQDKQDESEAG